MPDDRQVCALSREFLPFLLETSYSSFRAPLKCHSLGVAFLQQLLPTITQILLPVIILFKTLPSFHSFSHYYLQQSYLCNYLGPELAESSMEAKTTLSCSSLYFQCLAQCLACSRNSSVLATFWWVVPERILTLHFSLLSILERKNEDPELLNPCLLYYLRNHLFLKILGKVMGIILQYLCLEDKILLHHCL